ncbi:ATP-binding protein [Paenibacillus ihbetae]
MAIVYKLVQAHNGTITVESELSKGTTFAVLLPKKGLSSPGSEH